MTKTRIILIVRRLGWKSTLPGRRINPRLRHFIPVLQYGLHSLRIRKWQIHGRNYMVRLICWAAHYRKPRVAWKAANTARWASRGGSRCLAVLGKHREGVSLPWFPWRLRCVLSLTWTLLCHPRSARACKLASAPGHTGKPTQKGRKGTQEGTAVD